MSSSNDSESLVPSVESESLFSKDAQVDDPEREEEIEIGKGESLQVGRWKTLVAIMMILTGAVVVSSSYIFLSREEEDEFQTAVSILPQTAFSLLFSASLIGLTCCFSTSKMMGLLLTVQRLSRQK